MTVLKITLDTNILIYFIDKTDQNRHQTAIKIINQVKDGSCFITLQALAEFYNATVRKRLLSHKEASEIVQDWQTVFPIIFAKTTTLPKAIHITKNHQLSFWDAMLLSTAHEAGINMLLSEDFNHHQMIDGIRIVNPFQKSEFWKL